MKRLFFCLLMVVSLLSGSANAAWYSGTITAMGYGYAGVNPVFQIDGLAKTGCTCDASWPNWLCLSRSRQAFQEEYAFILKASATREVIYVNIDEATCFVSAMYALYAP